MGGVHRDRDHHPHADLDRRVVRGEPALVQIGGHRARGADAEAGEGDPGAVAVPGEVLPAQRLLRDEEPVVPHDAGDRLPEVERGLRVVLDRRYAHGVVDGDVGAGSADQLVDPAADQLLAVAPRVGRHDPHGAGEYSLGRDRVGTVSGPQHPAHDAEPGAWIDPAGSQSRQRDRQPGQGVDDVDGQVRTGGVSAVGAQRDLELVAGGGDRAAAGSGGADLVSRFAVQREDLLEALDRALVDHRQRSAEHLLGRLEDDPDADR